MLFTDFYHPVCEMQTVQKLSSLANLEGAGLYTMGGHGSPTFWPDILKLPDVLMVQHVHTLLRVVKSLSVSPIFRCELTRSYC